MKFLEYCSVILLVVLLCCTGLRAEENAPKSFYPKGYVNSSKEAPKERVSTTKERKPSEQKVSLAKKKKSSSNSAMDVCINCNSSTSNCETFRA